MRQIGRYKKQPKKKPQKKTKKTKKQKKKTRETHTHGNKRQVSRDIRQTSRQGHMR